MHWNPFGPFKCSKCGKELGWETIRKGTLRCKKCRKDDHAAQKVGKILVTFPQEIKTFNPDGMEV